MFKDLTENYVYKVNVYAIVYDSNQKEVESKELHEKVKPSLPNNFIFMLNYFR